MVQQNSILSQAIFNLANLEKPDSEKSNPYTVITSIQFSTIRHITKTNGPCDLDFSFNPGSRRYNLQLFERLQSTIDCIFFLLILIVRTCFQIIESLKKDPRKGIPTARKKKESWDRKLVWHGKFYTESKINFFVCYLTFLK